MARDDTLWDDPEFIARADAAQDHALERALSEVPEDRIDLYNRAYDAARREYRAADRRARRIRPWPDIGIGDLCRRAAARARRMTGSLGAEDLYPGFVHTIRPRAFVRIAGYAASLLVAGVLLAGVLLAGYTALRWNDISRAIAIVQQQMACAEVTAITDEDGRIVSYEPVMDAATCRSGRARLMMSFDDPNRLVARPGLTVPFVPEAEAAVVPALVMIEGQIAPFPQTVFGHDWRGFLRYSAAAVGLLSGERGFSSPILSTFEALLGHPNSMSVWDKPITVVAASIFTARYLPEEADRAAFVANQMMAVRGRGYPLGGRLAAAALFGHDPETLTQRCLLARAMGTPLVLPHERATVGAAAGEAWGSVLGPAARRCVTELAETPAEAAAALAEMEALCDGDDICARPSLEPDWDVRRARLATIAQANLPIVPERARESEAARRAILDGLRLAHDWTHGGTIATTIDRDALVALDRNMPDVLADLAVRLPNDMCFEARCAHQAIYSVAAVEARQGEALYRAGNASHHGQFFGPVRRGPNGYVALAPDRGMASVRKALLGLVAARHGYDALCSEAGGDAACTGGTWVSIERAMAQSLNAPFEWLASRHMDEINRLLDAIGAAPASRPTTARAIVLNTIRHAPPAAYATFFAALYGEDPTVSMRLGTTATHQLDLAALGYDATARARAREILAAPVSMRGGTLVATAHAAGLPGCTVLGGKSGTNSAGPVNSLKASVLVWRCTVDGEDRVFITTAVLTSGAADVSLGERQHVELAPLHRAALSAVTGITTGS